MIARAEFDQRPPEDERLAWCDWLRRHTIDPDDVPIHGWIEVDFGTYRISYLAYDRDDNGCKYFDPAKNDAAKSVRVVQLEARPSPFPERCGAERG